MSDILGNIDAALEGMPVPASVSWTRDKATGEYSAEVDGFAVSIVKTGRKFGWTVLDLSADGEAGKLADAQAAAIACVRSYLATADAEVSEIDAVTANTDDTDVTDVPGTDVPADEASGLVVEDLPFADPTVTEVADVPASVPSIGEALAAGLAPATVPAQVPAPAPGDALAILMAKVAEMEAAQAELRAENERLRTQVTPPAFVNPNAPVSGTSEIATVLAVEADPTRAAIIDDAMANAPEAATRLTGTPDAGNGEYFPPAFAEQVSTVGGNEWDSFTGYADPSAARREAARKLGREVAREVRGLFETFIVFPDELADAYAGTLALWCLHTHTYYYQRVTPYMLLTSPTAGAGKSTVEHIANRVTAHAIELVGPSVAAVRMLASDGHTLILDEVDELYQGKEFKSILNAGYTYGATVPRVKGKTVMMDKVFSPKMLAGIAREGNPVEGALLDRCIQIDLQRAAPGEVPYFDPQTVSEALREKITQWARLIVGDLERHPANMPVLDSPRAAQLWNPLVAVADVIGADWGENARKWAEEITGRREVQADPNIQILADTRDVLLEWIQANPQATHIETAVLCELRNRYAGRVFVDALTGIAYGRRLARFGIKSASIDKVRQYRVSDGHGQLHETLAAVFSRYCD